MRHSMMSFNMFRCFSIRRIVAITLEFIEEAMSSHILWLLPNLLIYLLLLIIILNDKPLKCQLRHYLPQSKCSPLCLGLLMPLNVPMQLHAFLFVHHDFIHSFILSFNICQNVFSMLVPI